MKSCRSCFPRHQIAMMETLIPTYMHFSEPLWGIFCFLNDWPCCPTDRSLMKGGGGGGSGVGSLILHESSSYSINIGLVEDSQGISAGIPQVVINDGFMIDNPKLLNNKP